MIREQFLLKLFIVQIFLVLSCRYPIAPQVYKDTKYFNKSIADSKIPGLVALHGYSF